jgi:nucleoside-diphosphate-sugar epimerase
MKKVLVTGVAGFIANKTAEFLLKDGIEIVGIDNMNDYYDVRLKEHRLEGIISNPKFTFKKIDIENKKELADLFNAHKFDAVLNLAARAGVRYSMENPDVYMSTNAQGTLNILNEMKKHGIKKMVLASTSSLYAGQPMPFNEDLPVNTPISPYAATKKAAEVMAYSYHFLYKMDISIVRYFTVYGPAGRPDRPQRTGGGVQRLQEPRRQLHALAVKFGNNNEVLFAVRQLDLALVNSLNPAVDHIKRCLHVCDALFTAHRAPPILLMISSATNVPTARTTTVQNTGSVR